MASTNNSTSFAPQHPSPLARTTSPFKDPRTPPPCTPRHTAKLWDEYERRAIENAKKRETSYGASSMQTPPSQRFSSGTVLDIIKSYDPYASATSSPQFDFDFPTSSTTLATCKTCKQGITSTSGICERCKKTIVIPSQSGETTPPLSPACRNFASTDLPKLHKDLASVPSSPTTASPKRKSKRTASSQLTNPPIRLSSLRPPRKSQDPKTPSLEAARPRKTSFTDPDDPFIRLQITRKPLPRTHPSSPTTPPSTSHSQKTSTSITRPSSLANITTPPQYASYSRHTSATPSELSTLYPYISNSTTTTTPPSVFRASCSLQNTTSAWDEWDSEDEEEKVGLVGYWRGKKWRGSRGSLGGTSGRRESTAGKDESGSEHRSGKEEGRRKRRGFVRVISCGCSGNE